MYSACNVGVAFHVQAFKQLRRHSKDYAHIPWAKYKKNTYIRITGYMSVIKMSDSVASIRPRFRFDCSRLLVIRVRGPLEDWFVYPRAL
jgi:hypothetical protein